MSDKTIPSNRQEVSELVELGETMSLQNIEREQLKLECSERVRSRREELGYTIEEFSKVTGLSPRTIVDIELGRTSPRSGTIVILCEHLKITSDYLLGLRNRNYDDVIPGAKAAHLVKAF